MSKHLIAPLVIAVILMSSCSVQKNVNPNILSERLAECSEDFIIENQGYYYKDDYFVMAEYKGIKTVLKMKTDKNQNVNKVCLSVNEKLNNEEINNLAGMIIEVYAPDEEKINMLNELNGKKSGSCYGKEHIYTLIIDNNTYFEILNIPLSDYTKPELTLKPNDRENF